MKFKQWDAYTYVGKDKCYFNNTFLGSSKIYVTLRVLYLGKLMVLPTTATNNNNKKYVCIHSAFCYINT